MGPHVGWKIIIASDVIRDGLGVEIISPTGDTVAEIFRCDADKTITVSTFDKSVPLCVVEWAIHVARDQLGAFEDGTPLPET